jgi:hypothetical protein
VTGDTHAAYYAAMEAVDDQLQDALADLRLAEDAGKVTVEQAAAERIRLLEQHLTACTRLRRELLRGQ